MFKKRKVTVTVGPKEKEQIPQIPDPEAFEKKATFVLRKLERIGVKIAVGVCAYVILDTYRQVSIAQANNQIPES